MDRLKEYKALLLKGDNSPLKTIYLENHDDVIRVLKSKNLCPENELESHFNEAMIQFYDRLISDKPMELRSIKNYLIGICINLTKRQNAGKLQVEEKIDQIRLHLYNNFHYTLNEEGNTKMIQLVKEKLLLLSEKCQEIIIAFYIDRLTMKEIAKYLDLSSGDVAKTLKSRCFKTLLNNVKSEV